jgi:hypothetical protein
MIQIIDTWIAKECWNKQDAWLCTYEVKATFDVFVNCSSKCLAICTVTKTKSDLGQVNEA